MEGIVLKELWKLFGPEELVALAMFLATVGLLAASLGSLFVR